MKFEITVTKRPVGGTLTRIVLATVKRPAAAETVHAEFVEMAVGHLFGHALETEEVFATEMTTPFRGAVKTTVVGIKGVLAEAICIERVGHKAVAEPVAELTVPGTPPKGPAVECHLVHGRGFVLTEVTA
jgi:hypothetical protein